ncbi:MAG: Gfo/Idh/MocA family oxidoreductase [Deltaproteobacteria bacterium]|jgi:UDP-2-acetamido-3-amino-2,3-dideoxy-glucuronate N-acetyltransferase|nr:Gfo/Idh/MocA family oxidoreductase [Deltaproteobacteria bacterium]
MVETSSTPKVAVIGTGYWGRNLVRDFYNLGALKTVCDSDRETLKNICQNYPGVNGVMSLEEVLADPQVAGVVLATPAPSHARLAISAMEAGRDVLVEKPLALTMEDGRAMVSLAKSEGRILMVDHLLNRHPAVTRLKEFIRAGQLGRICHVYSRRLNFGKIKREENAFWSLAPHDISLIMNLLGETPVSVQAAGGSFLTTGVEDVAYADLLFPAGITAHISVSWLNPFKEQRLVVIGLEQMAVFDDTAPWESKLMLYPHRLKWQGLVPEADKAEGQPIPIPQDQPLKGQCQAFLKAIESRVQPPDSHGDEALRVLAVLTAMDRSLKESRPQVPELYSPSEGYSVHPTAVIDQEVIIGENTKIWHFSHILAGSKIGPNCNIGQNVVIGPHAKVGRGCKIQNNVSVYEGVELEDDVFCGPSMVFTNVHNPRAFIRRMSELRPTLVRRGATIGANATIVCGHTLGEYSLIGAGAVVASDVKSHAVMVGVPARQKGWICRCGTNLGPDLRCPACGQSYREIPEGLTAL